jgi:stalled ribosome rescue protein Dom34
MKDYAVWLDTKDAKIFAIQGSSVQKTRFRSGEMGRATHHKKDTHEDSNSEKFYTDLAKKLKSADHLLIMGPGDTKVHFKTHLDKHQANSLAKKVIGVENFENLTEKEIMATANKFFKSHNL